MGVVEAGSVVSHLITTGTYLVSAAGELVRQRGGELGRELERLVDQGAHEVVVDLSDVTFVDSTAVAALLEAGKRSRRVSATVTVVCGDDDVRRVLEIVGIRRFLRLAETVTAAFAEAATRRSATAAGQAA